MLNNTDVISLQGNNVTLACFPSIQTLEVRWAFYGTTEVLSPSEMIESNQFIFEPAGLFHQITIINVSLDNTGNYSCEVVPNCNDSFAIAYNVTLTVVPG